MSEELCEDKLKKTRIFSNSSGEIYRQNSISLVSTSESGLDARFTTACFFEVLQSLECVGFHVTGLVCDGASTNLTLLKKLCGTQDQFGHDLSSADPFQVPCSFKNPTLVWVYCLS